VLVLVTPADPIFLLAMVDDIPDDAALVAASATSTCVAQIHDAPSELLLGLDLVCDGAVVFD